MAAGGHSDMTCVVLWDEEEECNFCCENYHMSGYYPYCSAMCEQEAAEARDRKFWAEIDEHDALLSHAEYLMEEMARVNAEREEEEKMAPCRLTRSSGAEEAAPLPCALTRSANTGPLPSVPAPCPLARSSANNTFDNSVLVQCSACGEDMELPSGASAKHPYCSAECAMPYLCGYEEHGQARVPTCGEEDEEKQYGLPPLLPLRAVGLPPLLIK